MIPPPASFAGRFARLAFAVSLLGFTPPVSAEIIVKDGERIGFLGDSITAGGWGNQAGYVKLIVAGFAANGVNIDAAPAGIGGHKSNQMLARLYRDVLSKKPQWMTLSCGVNDVAQGKFGVPLDDAQAAAMVYEKRSANEPEKGTFQTNIARIVEQAQAAGVKVMLLTATVMREDLANDSNQELAAYNDYLRQLAKEKQLPLADLNALFQERIKAANQPGKNVFTTDGVHMNTEGYKLMATGVLQAFGLDAQQIKRAQAAWAPLVVQAMENAKKVAEAKARISAEKAAASAAPVPLTK